MKLLNREEYVLWAEVYKQRIDFGDASEQASKAVLALRDVLHSGDENHKKIANRRNSDLIKTKILP